MNLAGKLIVISIEITGLALAVAGQPYWSMAQVQQITQALSPEQINLRAKQITVRIDGDGIGSGVIVDASDNTYTVLTNWHVVKNPGQYTVRTIDGRQHPINYTELKHLPGLDLATVKFTSNHNYQIADLGNPAQLIEGQSIYFAGYPGELRQEDNRYYRFFPANLVGVLPTATKNGYALIYNGEAFPGMSGGPILNKNALLIGIHGEANIHALTGAISNYGIPIGLYQQALANLDNTDRSSSTVAQQPAPDSSNPTPTPNRENKPDVPEITIENNNQNTTLSSNKPETNANSNNQSANKPDSSSERSTNVDNSNSATNSSQSTPKNSSTPNVEAGNSQSENNTDSSATASVPTIDSSSSANSESSDSATPETEPIISDQTGINYNPLKDLLAEGKWKEADYQTYNLIDEIVKTAKRKNPHTPMKLIAIADFACPDIQIMDRLWQKYSNGRFGFSSQQQIWSTVNEKGDFSTETWRNFATLVGWKEGDISSGSGYLLYEQLTFEPEKAPVGHLPWWFASPQEQQNMIKHAFARCNLNQTEAENQQQ